MKDLFEHTEELPTEVKQLIENYKGESYEECDELIAKLQLLGYDCVGYGLDAAPYGLHKIGEKDKQQL